MKAHKLLCAGAILALLGAPARAQGQEDGFFAGLKFRGAAQAASREDGLRPIYWGVGVECGYQLGFGRLSGEVGFTYKPGNQYLWNIEDMECVHPSVPLNPNLSKDSRKNMLKGVTLRLAYEMPLDKFSLRGGVELGRLKFRQEYIGTVLANDATYNSPTSGSYRDVYQGVHDKGGLSFSPFVGIAYPFTDNHFIELHLVGLNYKSIDYVHVAGGTAGLNSDTSRDRVVENSRFMPHLEVTFGFRF